MRSFRCHPLPLHNFAAMKRTHTQTLFAFECFFFFAIQLRRRMAALSRDHSARFWMQRKMCRRTIYASIHAATDGRMLAFVGDAVAERQTTQSDDEDDGNADRQIIITMWSMCQCDRWRSACTQRWIWWNGKCSTHAREHLAQKSIINNPIIVSVASRAMFLGLPCARIRFHLRRATIQSMHGLGHYTIRNRMGVCVCAVNQRGSAPVPWLLFLATEPTTARSGDAHFFTLFKTKHRIECDFSLVQKVKTAFMVVLTC